MFLKYILQQKCFQGFISFMNHKPLQYVFHSSHQFSSPNHSRVTTLRIRVQVEVTQSETSPSHHYLCSSPSHKSETSCINRVDIFVQIQLLDSFLSINICYCLQRFYPFICCIAFILSFLQSFVFLTAVKNFGLQFFV